MQEWAKQSEIDILKLTIGDSRLPVDLRVGDTPARYDTKPHAQKYEILKVAEPRSVRLSRQMVNTLDQAAKAESEERHKIVCDRIAEFVDRELMEVTRSLGQEAQARVVFKSMPPILHYAALKSYMLTREPFWRSLLRTNAQSTLGEFETQGASGQC